MIGILAVLAGISTVVFAKARSSAHSTVCIANLSKIGKALHLYLGENDDVYPPFVTYPRIGLGISVPAEAKQWRASLERFGESSVWQCPLDPDLGGPRGAVSYFHSQVTGVSSYETVGSLGLWEVSWPDGRVRINGSALPDPTKGYASDVWWSAEGGTDVVTVHGKLTHVLCHDGRVATDSITQR